MTILDRRILPAAQAILVDGAGRATQPFYDFLRRLVDATSLTPELVAEVQQLLQQMEQLQDGGFMPATSNVIGDDSIVSTGVLSNGVVTLELQGDTSDQRSTWYYGTNSANEKGWHRLYNALETGAGILKRNSGYVELGEVDDPDDLPDSGNPGEAYWVRGEGDIEERGLWVWDADAGEWALDTEASGIVGFEIAEGDYGDISVSDEGATWTINENVVTDEKLRDSAALSVIGRASNSTGDPADIVASVDKAVLHRNGTSLAFAPIDHTYISDFAEAAQDAVGGILTNTADIEFTYDDSAGEISAELSSTVHASLALADSALQPGDNISELANDANYVASGDNVSVLVNDAGYLVAADLAAVAFSGDYDDLANTPTIPPDVSSATFLTVSDETSTLANSRRLVAGSNVTLDTSTPGQIIINASGGGGGGQVDEIVGTPDEIVVDNTDPTKPVLSLDPAVTSALGLALTAVQPGDLAAVATSGDYDDLINTPAIPPDISSATFITADDETATLANSLKLVAGSNITFDDSTPGELKISASGGDTSDYARLSQPNEFTGTAQIISNSGGPRLILERPNAPQDQKRTLLFVASSGAFQLASSSDGSTGAATPIFNATRAGTSWVSASLSVSNTINLIAPSTVVDGTLTINAGGPALSLKPGSQDRAFMEFYADTQNPNARSAYFGFGIAGSSRLELVNEMALGDIYFQASGRILFQAPSSIAVVGRGGVLHYGDTTFTNARVFVRQGGSPVGTQEGDITIIW